LSLRGRQSAEGGPRHRLRLRSNAAADVAISSFPFPGIRYFRPATVSFTISSMA
jgi:hypothetical protein